MFLELNPEGMYNATKMCQGYGKQIKHYMENSRTKSYLQCLADDSGIPVHDLLYFDADAPNGKRATWIHEDAVIHLAIWISDTFAVQANKVVKRYLKGEITTEESQAAAAALKQQQRQAPQITEALEELKESLRRDMKRCIEEKFDGMVVVPAKKHKTDKRTKTGNQLRNVVREGLKHYMSTGQTNSETRATSELVQTSIEHFKQHMESQFQPGMTWLNFGLGDNSWVIAHGAKPVSTISDFEDKEQVDACFHYTNLKPHWSVLNVRESDRLTGGTLGRDQRKAAENQAPTLPTSAVVPAPELEPDVAPEPTYPMLREVMGLPDLEPPLHIKDTLDEFLDRKELQYSRSFFMTKKDFWDAYRTDCREKRLKIVPDKRMGKSTLNAALQRKYRDPWTQYVTGNTVKGVRLRG